jgi:hypothetical protein
MELVETTVDEYIDAKSRKAKSQVIRRIIDQIVATTNPRGGFVTKDPDTRKWLQVDLKVARDKVGSYLRDAAKRRSSDISWSSFIHHNPTVTNLGERHDLLRPAAFTRMELMEATLNSDTNGNGGGSRAQSYQLQYQYQHTSDLTNPTFTPAIGMLQMQNSPVKNRPPMKLPAQPLSLETAILQNIDHPSPPDEEQMKSSLEALAETFFTDDNNIDLEPRPIEDMIG